MKLIMENWRKYNKLHEEEELEEGMMQNLLLGAMMLFGMGVPNKAMANDAAKTGEKIEQQVKQSDSFSKDDLAKGIGFGSQLLKGMGTKDIDKQIKISKAMEELADAANSGDMSNLSIPAKSLVTAAKMSPVAQQLQLQQIGMNTMVKTR